MLNKILSHITDRRYISTHWYAGHFEEFLHTQSILWLFLGIHTYIHHIGRILSKSFCSSVYKYRRRFEFIFAIYKIYFLIDRLLSYTNVVFIFYHCKPQLPTNSNTTPYYRQKQYNSSHQISMIAYNALRNMVKKKHHI